MKLDNGRTRELSSGCGTFFSILMYLLLIIFAIQKLGIMAQRRKVYLHEMHLEHHFDDSFVFAGENGLNVAIVYENFKN